MTPQVTAHDENPRDVAKAGRCPRFLSELRGLVPTLVVMGVALSARSSIADHYHVPSGSMEPSVEIGDRIFVDKRAYGVRVPFTSITLGEASGPSRGEVVVLESPVDGRTLLKRVVAVPGDRVEVRSGQIILDGRPVPIEDSGREEALGTHRHRLRRGDGGRDFGPADVPPGKYLVMGDNRANSLDGRYFGLVDRDAIRGKALAVYYRNGFGWLDL